MKVIQDKITLQELQEMASNMFGDLVKTVVGVDSKEVQTKILKIVNSKISK